MSEAFDIAVVGSGAAGIAAAVSAARAGCRTLLLDHREGAGGTGGFSGLTTLCGLYDDGGRFLNDGFSREFAGALGEPAPDDGADSIPGPADPPVRNYISPRPLQMGRVWVLPYRPERFRAVATDLLSSTPGLQTRWKTALEGVEISGDRIVRVNGHEVGAVIDCSGSAEVARAVGLECLATDETTQAPAVIFPLCQVDGDLDTPAAIVKVLLPLARAGFPPLNFQSGPGAGNVTVKFSGSPGQVGPLIEFLRTRVGGFARCQTPLTEFTVSRRAGRMIPGRHLLTGAEVQSGRRFADAVARCAWPCEKWGADGVPRFQYLPPGTHYEIPAGSLRAAAVENLFMAGKTISADPDAIASARVMGCCLATGAAAGKLAAAHLASSHPE